MNFPEKLHDDPVKIPWTDKSASIFNKNASDDIHHRQNSAAHAFLYSDSSVFLFDTFPMNFRIMMQLRFDGKLGFPGGLINESEVPVDGLNRELTEEIALESKYYLTEEDYVCSWAQNELVDHFYIKKYSEEDFTNIESNVLSAKDWGGEVLGIIRVPLHELGNSLKTHPFVSFISHCFVANAQEQLIHGILNEGIFSKEEMTKFWQSYLFHKSKK